MKKLLTIGFVFLASSKLFAQSVASDSVTMGAGFANQIWYNMQSGQVSQSPNNNWELAFTTYFMGASAYSNSAQGVTVYMIPNTDTLGFSTVDTTGYQTWQVLHNSDTTWNSGAFNQNSGAFPNYGWGNYNQTSHEVAGDSLYLIRTGMNPNYEFKKLWLIKKNVQGNWVFRYANLDNTGDVTDTILMSDYSGKNFSYYSLANGSELNREPLTTDWDITFTRFTTNVLVAGCIPGTGYFNVTDILHNKKVVTAQADGADFSTVDFNSYLSQLDSNISTIGYDWKCSGIITPNLVYFVKANGGNIWKLQFTGYDFSIGKIIFNKQLVSGASTISSLYGNENSMSVYPNPSNGNSTLIVDSKKSGEESFGIYNAVGALVAAQSSNLKAGLNLIHLNTDTVANGIYFIRNSSDKNSATLKLVIAR